MEVPAIPLSPAEIRRRARENETPSQRIKREKAAERQRRKRERDRAGLFPSQTQANNNMMHDTNDMPSQEQYSLSPEEEARRDRVRAAARERQRKHRALVKSRKMRDMGTSDEYNGGGGGSSESQNTPSEEQTQYHQVLAELSGPHPEFQPPPPPTGPTITNGGQTFATTLLLSFSCSPMLKTHLLRTLNMTNDELTSFEPIIAEAWERWNIARQGGFPPTLETTMEGLFQQGGGEDFRARFHRPLVAPTPFQQQEIDPSLKPSE
ncbi:hypothetical protein CPB85DRAFT_1272431 [Mucidula mucida]|nr:hypothetical protein CPB85DRAFT_1272431 [Mucidula mucida]